MTLSDLDGFLTGIAVGPEPIPPREWLPVVWGEEAPTVPPNSSWLLYWMIGVLVAYILLISFFGLKDYRLQRAYYEKEWERVLNQNGSKPRTLFQVPHAPTEEA